MKYKTRMMMCVIVLAMACRAVFGQEEIESRTFGYWEGEADRPDSIEAVVFQPDPDAEQAFLLYLESSQDLETWETEGLQSYQVNDDGTVVATGEDSIDRKFWRMRIMHPNAHPEEDWLAVLKISRAETAVTAMLKVRTNYHPFVENYVQHSIDMLPIEWDPEVETPEAVAAATESALQRLLEIVHEVQPADGDHFEATRPIEE